MFLNVWRKECSQIVKKSDLLAICYLPCCIFYEPVRVNERTYDF